MLLASTTDSCVYVWEWNCVCVCVCVCVCMHIYICAHMCLPRGVWMRGGLCVCVCVFLFPCLFVRINMWEREKWLFLSAVLLCEHEGKVSFSAQITARADKAAFRVGSNPQRQTLTLAHTRTLFCNPHSSTVIHCLSLCSHRWHFKAGVTTHCLYAPANCSKGL